MMKRIINLDTGIMTSKDASIDHVEVHSGNDYVQASWTVKKYLKLFDSKDKNMLQDIRLKRILMAYILFNELSDAGLGPSLYTVGIENSGRNVFCLGSIDLVITSKASDNTYRIVETRVNHNIFDVLHYAKDNLKYSLKVTNLIDKIIARSEKRVLKIVKKYEKQNK